MLDLKVAAALARGRITERLRLASANQKNAMPRSAAVIQQGSSFRAHLIEALQRGGDERTSPSPAPVALFLAFPEKLLGKWHHLAYGPQRQSKEPLAAPSKDIDEWRRWDEIGNKTKIINFVATQPKAILVAHGLAAIEDSILLLADIGRCSRAARSMNVPLRVLLADVSWISYNRSLRRFDLTDAQIESGLRSCQASRKRLYEGVGAEPRVHAILPYSKKGEISGQKIQMIAAHYLQLASNLWGVDKINSTEPLSNTDVAEIGRHLQASLGSDSSLQFLTSFPGALPALEVALGEHLSVIRTIAQRFRVLSTDTFSYFFAQYYAQDEYRGTHVKVAPESERDFDEPFDELDSSFRLWGEGSEPTVTTRKDPKSRKRRMAAVYLPHYSIGDWNLLPYSPLSLSAVSASGGLVKNVRDKVILLSDCDKSDQSKVETLLRATRDRAGFIQLNRLIADLLSFLQAVAVARGRRTIETACMRIDRDFDQLLSVLHFQLSINFSTECEPNVSTGELWQSWLDGIDRDSAVDYVPCHLLVASLSHEDWTDERFGAASEILVITARLARDLSL